MRHAFPAQPDRQLTPIEKIRRPRQSRDELPPILAGLQWIGRHPTLRAEIFALLAAKVLAGKKVTGRSGLDRWPILVLGVVRLGLDPDWDRMEDLANHHLLIRQMLVEHKAPFFAGGSDCGEGRKDFAKRRAPFLLCSTGMKHRSNSAAPPPDRGAVTVRVAASAQDIQWFDARLAERHSLGAGRPVGDYLRQIVEVDGRPAALLVWGPACYALKDRDRWISWSAPSASRA